MTGNAKGLICVWQFQQTGLQCLNAYILEPEIPLKETKPKKATVIKIEFTPYGDKFISLNLDGSLFLHSFGIDDDKAALFTYKGQKISDFGQIDNDGTVLAVLSCSNKTLSILDLITGEILASVKTSANLLQVDSQRQCLYTFNSKSGSI